MFIGYLTSYINLAVPVYVANLIHQASIFSPELPYHFSFACYTPDNIRENQVHWINICDQI